MTHWRDARLKQALAHAPDDGLRPAEAVRAAVLQSARRAVAGVATAAPVPAPFWRRAWQAMGRSGQPWNAAFATIVLACLVTVLWWDKPVPDAEVERPPFKAPAAQVARPAAPVTGAAGGGAPTVAAAAPKAPEPAPAPEKKAQAKPQASPPLPAAPAGRAAPAEAPAAVATAPAAAPAPAPALAAPAAPAAPPAATAQADARADAAVAGPERSKALPAPAATPAPLPAPAFAPAPAPAAAPPALRREAAAPATRDLAESSNRSAAAAGGMAGLSAAQAPNAATRAPEPLALTLEGRPLSFTPAQGQRIEALVQALAAQANSGEPLQSRVVAAVRLLRDPAASGTLQLAPPQVRWQPVRPGAQALTGRPEGAQLQELLEALQQLPAR